MLHRVSLLPLLGSLFLLAAVGTTQAQRNANQIVRFNFRYGFFEDDQTPDTDIMKDDIEGVICQTQYFLSQIVQNATDSKSVHARATEIDWGYYEGQDTPAHINFTVEFDDAEIEGDVNAIDDEMLINRMQQLDNVALQKYITEWVWKSEPLGLNFFVNANRMAFDGVQQAPVEGVLKEAECPETTAPTHAPTISMPPTMGPTISPAPTTEAEKNNNPGQSGAGGFPGGIGGFGGPNAGNGNGNGGNPNGNGNGNGGAGDPNGGDWPFGPNYESFADLKPMADFSLSFSMFEDHEVPPTVKEVNALICQINGFFTEELRRKLTAPDIHMKAVYIDYYFEEGGKGSSAEDIRLNFTAFTYYGRDAHEQVVVQDVFETMKLRDAELKDLVENYVWKSEPEQENVFYHTESLGLNAGMGKELDPSKSIITEASGCILPPDDDGTPFEGVPGPGSGLGPGGNGNGGAGNNGNGNGNSDLGMGSDAKQTEITVNFRVSNLENIKEENAVKASGLDSSFPVFTNELVNELTQRDALARGRVLRNGRRLRVVPIPGTATVNELQEYDCPASALPGLTCHSARAKYDVLMSSEEDTAQVQTTYTDASETAVNDGTYNNVLQRVDPNTPLYIGIMTDKSQIPPGSLKRGYDGEPDNDDDGWFKWWYILILLLLLLLCCLCCLYCMVLNKKDEPAKETTVEEEEREVLVEEFDDEDIEPDDEEPNDEDEDEEEFVDDPNAPAAEDPDAAAGMMVPFDPNQAPAPAPAPPAAGEEPPVVEQGVLVPYDPQAEKASQDQAERERILSGSNSNLEHKKDDDQVWEEDV